MAGTLRGGGQIFSSIPPVVQPSRGGLTVGTRQGQGLFQGAAAPPPNPVALFLAHSMEPIVRPAVPDKAYRLLDRLLARRPKSGELPEASVLWGQASDFEVEELKAPEKPTSGGIRIIDPDEPDEEDPGPTTIDWTEVSRTVHVKRITQEGNAENWVDVEVIDEIVWALPNGIQVRQILDNPD